MKIDTRINSGSYELHVHMSLVDQIVARPTVVFSHGFSVDGTESHRMFMNVSSEYNKAGINTVLFDYRGCGYSDGDFREFNLTGAIEDIQSVLKWLQNKAFVESSKVFIHGQSLGCAIAVAALYNSNLVNSFILWNLSANLYERYKVILGHDILENNEVCIPSKGLYVKSSFMDDIKNYDILSYFKHINIPVLFLNSGNDSVGDPNLSFLAKETLDDKGIENERYIIENANHSFKCQLPLENKATSLSIQWLMGKLNG